MSRPNIRLGVVMIDGADPCSAGVTEQTPSLPVVAFGGEPAASITHWAVVPPGVRLLPEFTARMTAALEAGGRGAAYCDFSVDGQRIHVGDWSVERSRWQDYTGPVMVVPAGHDPGSAKWLRVAMPRQSGSARCLRQVLYTAAADDIQVISGSTRDLLWPGLPYSFDDAGVRHLPVAPTVSIVIPTKGASGNVRGNTVRFIDACLESLAADLAAPGVDVVVVVGRDDDTRFLDRWRESLADRLQVITVAPPFNFAERINAGAAMATGDFLVALNDDVEVSTPEWLTEMVALASEPDVGAVGARLLYEDGTVQHGGHVFHGGGVHLLDSGSPDDAGTRGRNTVDRDVSGVTAACLVQRREVWQQLGGLDPAFPVAFNDVDYCERMRSAGLRIVLCNRVRLHHFESRSRPGTARQWEVDLLRSRWAVTMDAPDPFTPDWQPPPGPTKSRLREPVSSVKQVIHRFRGH